MSMFSNSFDLLEAQDAEGYVAAKSKQRKKSKKKAVAPDQPIAAPASAPQPDVVPEDEDFQVVARQGPRSRPNKASGIPARVADACEALESAAAGADARSRAELVSKWLEQAVRGEDQFLDTSGAQLGFVQVLTRSKALESLLDGYITTSSSVAAAEAGSLGQLLSAAAHASLPPSFGALLAQTVAALSSLLAADPLAPAAHARRSLEAAVGLLKRGVPKTEPKAAPAARLQSLEASLSKQEASLVRTTLPKEQGKLWVGVLDTLGQQIDLLQLGGPGGLPAEVATVLRPLQDLQTALESRLKSVTAPPPPALPPKEQIAAAQAAHRQEDAALASKISAAEARIQRLEAELAAAKAEAGALRAQRTAADQHHQKVVEQIRAGGSASSATPTEHIVAVLNSGISSVGALAGTVEGTAGTAASALDAGAASALAQRLEAGEVPAKLVGAVQQVVDLNLALLQELVGKAAFYRQRLVQAARQAEQLAKLNMEDPRKSEESKRQRVSLDKMLAEVLSAADAAAAAARTAVDTYHQRMPQLMRIPGFQPPPPEYGAGLEAKAAEAAALCRGIHDPAMAAPPAPAAPRAPPAPPSPARSPASAATSEPVVPPPAPAAGRSAAPGSGRAKAAPLPPTAPAAAAAGPPPSPTLDMSSLQARLAALEEANRQKDAQIAAMLSSATAVDVTSPLAALGIPPMSSGLLASNPMGLMPATASGTLVPSAQVLPAPSTANGPQANGHAPEAARKEGGGRRRRA